MARLFVAVYPPAAAVHDLEAAVARVRGATGLRWSPVAHWHVTLAFLGDVADEAVPSTADAIGAAVTAHLPFRLSLRGAGRFGGRGGAVVWAGVSGDVERLVELSSAVGAAARAAGATYPDRRPQPHLTLGRVVGTRRGGRGRGAAVDAGEAVLSALDAYTGPPWDVDEVRLVQSRLGPPLRHEPVERWTLTGA